MSSIEVLLTVGKLDASLALLTTQDHHVIEFPTLLLPENVRAGSIVRMQVMQDVEEGERQRAKFKEIQETILEKYGVHRPHPPVLKVVNVTQTSCVLAWDPLALGSARLKALILYRQGLRSMVIPNPFNVTSTKISGLSVDTQYDFQLKLMTTAGQFWSEKIKVHTHKMTDMSGITVCLGPLDPALGITENQIKRCLESVGARKLQKHIGIDTTHFICNDESNEDDPELAKAKASNIPVIRPEWIRACAVEKRIIGVRAFYLDADKAILQQYPFPPLEDNEDIQEESEPEINGDNASVREMEEPYKAQYEGEGDSKSNAGVSQDENVEQPVEEGTPSLEPRPEPKSGQELEPESGQRDDKVEQQQQPELPELKPEQQPEPEPEVKVEVHPEPELEPEQSLKSNYDGEPTTEEGKPTPEEALDEEPAQIPEENMQDIDLNEEPQELEEEKTPNMDAETTVTTALETDIAEGTENPEELVKEDTKDVSNETQEIGNGEKPMNGSKKRKQKKNRKARGG